MLEWWNVGMVEWWNGEQPNPQYSSIPVFQPLVDFVEEMPVKENLKLYSIANLEEIETTPCPCGTSRRAFTDDPDQIASIHMVDIKVDSEVHYHKRLTEIYLVLEGEGRIELDGDAFPIKKGTTIMIKPGCRHRAVGKLKIINIPIPAFDPEDEWFD